MVNLETNQRAAFYEALLENVSDGIYFVDLDRRILYWNAAAERLSGYSRSQMVGQICGPCGLTHCDERGESLCGEGCPLSSVIQNGKARTCEVFLRHRDGYRVPVHVTASPMVDENGATVGVVEIFSDNSDKVAAMEETLRANRKATIDPLTEAGNRRYGEDVIARYLGKRVEGEGPGGVVFVDVDRFKAINDRFGHAAGDLALQTIVQTLKRNVRSMDAVCRWGGDEFLIFMPGAPPEVPALIAERCRRLVESSSCEFEGRRISFTCSVGVTLIQPGDTLATMLSRADLLMYRGKHAGGNQVAAERGLPVLRLETIDGT